MKRIIEIEEKDYDQICEVVNETESSLGIIPFAGSIIAQSKPYDDSGDLISREDLKKAIEEVEDNYDGYEPNDLGKFMNKVYDLIDNAPPVPERDYSQGWHDAITKALNEAYTITIEGGSFKVVQTETLEGLGMSMPDKKGECCGSCYLCDVGGCGADMRKGGAK